jgi:hypothetical protein
MILPDKASVEMNSKVFDRLDLRYVCLVDVHWGALTSSQSERDVGRFGFV